MARNGKKKALKLFECVHDSGQKYLNSNSENPSAAAGVRRLDFLIHYL
ncbi:hypothetical protein GAGA_0459 [Paraglaciecola agarilytica NO2]|uniref:Uncharacterized protein n=1 Tax=Paraglaciecola agarilytica NO2 TaxID=1125747 RepID=A0ABQ0I1Y5_9ALTE|nr:hypothetical protein GAGA_0459 [Paraglaciecola agarilytica NO2]